MQSSRSVLTLVILLVVEFFGARLSADADQRLRVGVIAPLSGPAADYGIAIRNAIALSEPDPQKIEFLFEDTPYTARAAVDSFNTLRNVRKVDLLYVWGVVFCEALAPLAEQAKLPMIAQCIQENINRDRSRVVRFANPAPDYTHELWKAVRALQKKRLALILTDNAYLQLMADTLERGKNQDETLLLLDRYQNSQTDFRSTISKLRMERPDALFVFLGPGQIGPFYRQLREQQIVLPTFGTNLFESDSEIRAAGGAMDGAIIANNTVSAEFQKRYFARFGNKSQITFAAYAFDFGNLLKKYLDTPERESKDILAGLLEIHPEEGACGRIFLVQGEGVGSGFSYSVSLKKLENSEFQNLP